MSEWFRAALLISMLLAPLTALAQSATQPAPAADAKAAGPEKKPPPRQLTFSSKPWTGDFDKMLERRLIRVAIPYSRTLFFNDKGVERGITIETMREFERYLNKKYQKQLGKRPLTIAALATTRDKLLPHLNEGLADLALGNLTMTPERLATVDMVSIPDADVRELLLTGPKSQAIATIDDLAGKTVHVRRASSYYDSLVALNERFQRDGKAKVEISLVPDALEDEDMMEMLNTGMLQAIIVDGWKAKVWAPTLKNVKVHDDVVLRGDGHIGTAIRKGSPLFEAALKDFYLNAIQKQGGMALRLRQFSRRIKQFTDATGTEELKRFNGTVSLFEKYSTQYNFDPLMLSAQGYQESRLDHNARSQVGAIGIMQIMPATGGEMKVGDIHKIEPNIHAAAKYMDQLMARYFADANFSAVDRTLFAFAAYNCGPGNVAKARKEAAKLNLDPNKWFNNVEVVIARRIGMETTTYVRNIYKYNVAYTMIAEAQRQAAAARESLKPEAR